MTTRYKKLPNFPQRVTDLLLQKYDEEIGDGRVADYPNQFTTIQPHLKMVGFPVEMDLPEFDPYVIFLISDPNSGMGIPHTDKSRDFCLNIPIRVNLDKGDYIAGRFESLSDYPEPESFVLEGKTGLKFEYDEKYFENVRMDTPIFINTGLPHSWINDDDHYRVLASLYFKTRDVEEASRIVDQWV